MCSSRYARASIALKRLHAPRPRDRDRRRSPAAHRPVARPACPSSVANFVEVQAATGRRRAKQAPAEPGALLVGPVHELERDCAVCAPLNRRSASNAAITPSVPSSHPPFGTESRWPPMMTVRSDSPGSVAQLLPAASTTGSQADLPQAVHASTRALRAIPAPMPRRCAPSAVLVFAAKLAEIGDDIPGAHAWAS